MGAEEVLYMRDRRNVESRAHGGMTMLYLLVVALTCIFVVLKSCGVINWSWIWVSFPLLAYLIVGAIVIGVFIVCLIRLEKK